MQPEQPQFGDQQMQQQELFKPFEVPVEDQESDYESKSFQINTELPKVNVIGNEADFNDEEESKNNLSISHGKSPLKSNAMMRSISQRRANALAKQMEDQCTTNDME